MWGISAGLSQRGAWLHSAPKLEQTSKLSIKFKLLSSLFVYSFLCVKKSKSPVLMALLQKGLMQQCPRQASFSTWSVLHKPQSARTVARCHLRAVCRPAHICLQYNTIR